MDLSKLAIKTEFWAKPIPIRDYDWQAWIRDREECGPFGWGATEQAAIEDLKEWFDDAV